jgi:hypothetical protein
MRNFILKDEVRGLFRDYPCSDPHCHTYYSDGCWDVHDLVKKAKKLQIKVAMKADHNTCRGNLRLKRLCDEEGLLCIPGIEISTNKGHMVGVNVLEWEKKSNNLSETIDQLHTSNAAAILAHPWWRGGIRDEVFSLKNLDGFEGFNGSSPLGSLYFLREIYSKANYESINSNKYPVWAGSDSHGGYMYGQYRMVFLTTDFSVDGIMDAIFKRKIIAIAPFCPLWSFFADGALNQPVQLKRELFYKKQKRHKKKG